MKSEIVQHIFDYAENNLDYLILRNYENLPEDEGHDIDFLVDESELYKKDLLIKELKEKYNVRVYRRQQYYGLCGYAIVIENQTILHLDFFTKIQWNRFNFIPTKDALQRRKRFKDCLWVIGERDLCYYCWVNYIRAKGKIKDKYKKYAFQYESQYNKDKMIDIVNKSADSNKRELIRVLVREATIIGAINNSIANVWFKVRKLFNMDGRIYITDEIDNKTLYTARRYCSCKIVDIKNVNDLHILNVIKRLYLENSILISPAEWNKFRWKFLIPGIYIIKDISDLNNIVRNIYRNVED